MFYNVKLVLALDEDMLDKLSVSERVFLDTCNEKVVKATFDNEYGIYYWNDTDYFDENTFFKFRKTLRDLRHSFIFVLDEVEDFERDVLSTDEWGVDEEFLYLLEPRLSVEVTL